MQRRSSRSRPQQKKTSGNGKIFVQVILCIAIICGFMMFKDSALPNGKTPREYAEKILTTTVNLPEIIARFKEDAVLPAGTDVVKP
ncbi:MAG: hypothetical protein WCX81_01880 [Monoglobales bacterium]